MNRNGRDDAAEIRVLGGRTEVGSGINSEREAQTAVVGCHEG